LFIYITKHGVARVIACSTER